jgi:hypothetical protein
LVIAISSRLRLTFEDEPADGRAKSLTKDEARRIAHDSHFGTKVNKSPEMDAQSPEMNPEVSANVPPAQNVVDKRRDTTRTRRATKGR